MRSNIPIRMITRAAIKNALVKLGDNPTTIAKRLRRRGIKGIKNSAASCPVARYLRNEFEPRKIEVGSCITLVPPEVKGHKIRPWIKEIQFDDKDCIQVDLPIGFRKFIRKFDNGQYPALDARRAGGKS